MKIESPDGQSIDFWSNPNLPQNPERVSMAMSGGADSTILLVLLCEHFKDQPITICPACGEDVNRASVVEVVEKIIDEVRLMYPQHTIEEPIAYPFDKLARGYVKARKVDVPKHMIDTKTDVFMTGKNLAPPGPEWKGFGRCSITNVKESRLPGGFPEWGEDGLNIYNPLYNVDKKFIAYLYQYFHVMNTLFPLTVSCVDMMEDNPVPCKQCAWCREKKWAFGMYDFGWI